MQHFNHIFETRNNFCMIYRKRNELALSPYNFTPFTTRFQILIAVPMTQFRLASPSSYRRAVAETGNAESAISTVKVSIRVNGV